MAERIVFDGVPMTKAHAVSRVASGFVDELLHRARREGGTRDYYHIAVLGYSGEGVQRLLSYGGEFVTPSRLAAADVRRENVARERMLPSGRSVMTVTEQNVWIEARAVGPTPMCEALREALSLVSRWCAREGNSQGYPPTIINITDGEVSDGSADEVRALASAIRATGTADGHTVLVNIHLAQSGDKELPPVLFPASLDELPTHRYARLLWDASSEMPAAYNDMICSLRAGAEGPFLTGAQGPFRAVGWGTHIAGVAAMMNIGSVNTVML
jgi:hypothetical protein